MFCILILFSVLIHIMLVLTLRAAKYIIGSAGDKCLLTVFTEAQRFLFVGQHKAEHELNCHQKRMKIPNDCRTGCRLIKQGDMIGRCDFGESFATGASDDLGTVGGFLWEALQKP